MEYFDILGSKGLLLLCTLLKVLRQSISNSISLAILIIDLEVVTKEILSPANLFRVQTFCIHETMEIVVIDKYEYLMLRAF